MAEPFNSTFTMSEEWFDSSRTRCAARFYRPTAADRPLPVVVMAHGFGSVRALRLYAYAERFAAAGYAVVVFDYRNFGDSEGEPRQVLDIAMQHEDWRAALDYARSIEGVDPARVVAWGTSFMRRPRHHHRRARRAPRRRHRSGPARQRPGSGEVDRPAGRSQARRARDS